MGLASLARTIGVPTNRISQIIAGKPNITADAALHLARYFGPSADFWMDLQKSYELDLARRELGPAIEAIPSRKEASASCQTLGQFCTWNRSSIDDAGLSQR